MLVISSHECLIIRKFLSNCVPVDYSDPLLVLHLVPISLPGYDTHKVVNTGSFHTTPNTSLGVAQATPSTGQPSPTVHTKEALGKAVLKCGP